MYYHFTSCLFGNTGKSHFFGIQFQNQQVQLRASDFALPWYLVSRPVSRQSRLETLVFQEKTDSFAAEGVGFELG
jgi:hypothetical protein